MYNYLFWNRLKVIIGVSALNFAVACSSPKTLIDDGAIYINERADTTKEIARDILSTTAEPDTAEKAQEIVVVQDDIIETASEIRTNLHGVQDTTPWWARMISQFSIALITIGVIVLLWQTGVGMFIKKLFWMMGLFIPQRAMRSAEVDSKALDETNPLSYRESVAVRRSSDPAYEYALKKVRNRS
jgi:hypothetical protein